MIEVYADSGAVCNFPIEAMIVDLLRRRRFVEINIVPCGSDGLAERCRLLAVETAA